MTIQEYLKAKTSLKDLVEIKGMYFESRSIKQYLKLLKKTRYEVRYDPHANQLVIDYPRGWTKFNPITIVEYKDCDNITYQSHSNKRVLGKAHSIEL